MKNDHITIENPFFNVVLYQPEIPANTGNIARLCGAAMLRLHLIHPLGFRVDDKHLKRAGLDYWAEVDVRHHESFESFLKSGKEIENRLLCFSKFAEKDYTKAKTRRGDYMLFGQESLGLPVEIRKKYPCFRIPIPGKVRSLNLSTSVGIVTYHYMHMTGCF
ncbi:tRNA (cytidine(34)-2'-O)-methyltransferase [Thermodesulfobacteriota bacterium]